MTDETDTGAVRPAWLFPARLALGLAQGLALYLLYHALQTRTWPVPEPFVFAPLVLVALYVPLLASLAMGAMRMRTSLIWILVATAVTFWLGWYDRFHATPITVITNDDQLIADFSTFFFGFIGLFIAQALIAAGDSERRAIARYDAYFDVAWKMGLQFALAAIFVAVFWGVLWLGAAMFELIKLDFLKTLLEKDWFWIPATALATAAAIELTDVRARLVAGIRSVVLTLLGWLLPLLALIAGGFIVGLFFTGLSPLWATRAAAGGLLGAVAALVVLINTAYQNGEADKPAVLRIAELVAMLAITPLTLIAAYALMLRVHQYGWTLDRLATLDCVIVACVYAAGYGAAAVMTLTRPGRIALLEYTNIAAAVLVLVLLGSLFNRFTDPMKISTDDQIGRLRAGTVSAVNFDYDYLRTNAGRFGHRALEKLAVIKDGRDAAAIRSRAHDALNVGVSPPAPSGPLDIARNVAVYPQGQSLPKSFVSQDWVKVARDTTVPACLTVAGLKCEADLVDLDGDGTVEIIIVTGEGGYWYGSVMRQDKNGQWVPFATLPSPHCPNDLDALRTGAYRLVSHPTPVWRDIQIGGHAITLTLPDKGNLDCTP
jgi:hypothetical protein